MRTSETTAEIGAALAAAQSSIEHVGKGKTVRMPTKKGGTITFKYAELGNLIDCVRAAFAEHGLSFVQGSEPMQNGLMVYTRVLHKSGEWIEGAMVPVGANIADPKSVGSATTYARRYSLATIAGIAQVDDDGQAAAASPPKREAKPKADPLEARKQAARERVAALPDAKVGELRAWMQEQGISGRDMTAEQLAQVEKALDAAEHEAAEAAGVTA